MAMWLPLFFAACVLRYSMGDTTASTAVTTVSSNTSAIDYGDYDYDLNESHAAFDWTELAPALAVYGATFSLGVAGNSLIIFTVCRYRRMATTTNVFLSSLASADLLLITVCIPVKVAKLFSYTWTMGAFLCKTVHYMQNVSFACSVLTLTAMSIERYYAIVHPMRAKYVCTIRQARRVIAAIWCASFLLAVPIIFLQVQLPVGVKVRAFWCVRDWDRVAPWRLHELYMLVLVLVLPTAVMAAAYSAICWEVWHVMRRRGHMRASRLECGSQGVLVESLPLRSKRPVSWSRTSSMTSTVNGTTSTSVTMVANRRAARGRDQRDVSTVKQVVKMLVAVVCLFVVCWSPLLVDNVLTAFGVLPPYRTGQLKHMATAFHLMAYFNSCINPVVYGFMSRNFRESFRKALCRCCCRKRRNLAEMRRPSPSRATRTTSVRYTGTAVGADNSGGRLASASAVGVL